MSEATIITDFIEFNSSIFKEIKEEDETIGAALDSVMEELLKKYATVIPKATKKQKFPIDSIVYSNHPVKGKYYFVEPDNMGVVVKAHFSTITNNWVYKIKYLDENQNPQDIDIAQEYLIDEPITVKPVKKTIPKVVTQNSYSVGDDVETLSGQFEGTGEIRKAIFDKIEKSWVYTIIDSKKNSYQELEDNLFLSDLEESEDYANMSISELTELKNASQEMINLLDDSQDAFSIEEESKVEQIELEIESRN